MLGSTPLLFTELRENLPSFTTGILPSQSIEELIAAGHITGNPPVAPEQVQPSSLDLRIGPVAYRIRASFLSSRNARVLDKLHENHLYKLDLTRPLEHTRSPGPLLEEEPAGGHFRKPIQKAPPAPRCFYASDYRLWQ
jgi:hypothetical protein